uniref:Uncharacterized protein n=1 Tax=Avena sativa TaxID=4498 RepID=A0ACD5V875_AVESA
MEKATYDGGEKKGKTILGKRCKRITDFLEEKYNSLPSVPREETSTEQVLKASRLNSPSPTLEAPGLGHGDYDRDRGDNYKLPETSPIKKAKHSKGSDEGKDVAIDNPVAGRKEELETYKDVKTKQTESYRDMKTAQMEENDPDKDPYCIGYCIDKVKSVGNLTAIEQLKMIDYLKDKRMDREIFMKVEHDVVVEMYKEVIGRQV